MFYFNLRTLEGLILNIILEGSQSNNMKMKRKKKLINNTSKDDKKTGASFTK